MKRLFLLAIMLCLIAGSSDAAFVNCGDLGGQNSVHVDAAATGFMDGSEDYPFDEIQDAIIDAINNGYHCIKVKVGTYNEDISIREGIQLYGGFKSDSFDWEDRDYNKFESLIAGISAVQVVFIPFDVTPFADIIFDGFHIDLDSDQYHGIRCQGVDNVRIINNTIVKDFADSESTEAIAFC